MKAEEFDKRQENESKREYRKFLLFGGAIVLLLGIFLGVWLSSDDRIVKETTLIDGIGDGGKLIVLDKWEYYRFLDGHTPSEIRNYVEKLPNNTCFRIDHFKWDKECFIVGRHGETSCVGGYFIYTSEPKEGELYGFKITNECNETIEIIQKLGPTSLWKIEEDYQQEEIEYFTSYNLQIKCLDKYGLVIERIDKWYNRSIDTGEYYLEAFENQSCYLIQYSIKRF